MNVLTTWKTLDERLGEQKGLWKNATKESILKSFDMLDEKEVKRNLVNLKKRLARLRAKTDLIRAKIGFKPGAKLSTRRIVGNRKLSKEEAHKFMENFSSYQKREDVFYEEIRYLEQQLKKLQKSDIRKMRASMLHVLRREGMFTMDSKRFGKLYLSYKSEEPSPSQWQDIFTGHTWKNRRFFEGLDSFPSDKPIEMKLIDEANGYYLDPYYQLLAYVDPSREKHLIPLPVFVDALQNDKYKELYKQSMDDVFYREDPLETALEEAKKDFNLKFETISKEEWYAEDSSGSEKNLNEEQFEE